MSIPPLLCRRADSDCPGLLVVLLREHSAWWLMWMMVVQRVVGVNGFELFEQLWLWGVGNAKFFFFVFCHSTSCVFRHCHRRDCHHSTNFFCSKGSGSWLLAPDGSIEGMQADSMHEPKPPPQQNGLVWSDLTYVTVPRTLPLKKKIVYNMPTVCTISRLRLLGADSVYK